MDQLKLKFGIVGNPIRIYIKNKKIIKMHRETCKILKRKGIYVPVKEWVKPEIKDDDNGRFFEKLPLQSL